MPSDKASCDPRVGQGLKAKKARYRIRYFETHPYAPTGKIDGKSVVTMTEAERVRWRAIWKGRYERAKAYLVTLALLKD